MDPGPALGANLPADSLLHAEKSILCCRTPKALNSVSEPYSRPDILLPSFWCVWLHCPEIPSHPAHLSASFSAPRANKMPILCNTHVTTFWEWFLVSKLGKSCPALEFPVDLYFFFISLMKLNTAFIILLRICINTCVHECMCVCIHHSAIQFLFFCLFVF